MNMLKIYKIILQENNDNYTILYICILLIKVSESFTRLCIRLYYVRMCARHKRRKVVRIMHSKNVYRFGARVFICFHKEKIRFIFFFTISEYDVRKKKYTSTVLLPTPVEIKVHPMFIYDRHDNI